MNVNEDIDHELEGNEVNKKYPSNKDETTVLDAGKSEDSVTVSWYRAAQFHGLEEWNSKV